MPHLAYNRAVNPKVSRQPKVKLVDETHVSKCKCGLTSTIREEVWVDERGAVVKYNLAFIHFGIYQGDNGRVFGFDNAHGYPEMHLMGKAQRTSFATYSDMAKTFYEGVSKLKEAHEKRNRRR